MKLPNQKEVPRMEWQKYPDKVPKKPGKYLVVLECADRTWTSIKLWEQEQISRKLYHGHSILVNKGWLLGCEFHDTKVIAWCPIPPYQNEPRPELSQHSPNFRQ